MINEYTFYYGRNEYIFNKPEEKFDVNNHKVSREVYNKLYEKVFENYKLCTTQQCHWSNPISGAYSFSSIDVFKRKDNENTKGVT